jgi:hypothetical protein
VRECESESVHACEFVRVRARVRAMSDEMVSVSVCVRARVRVCLQARPVLCDGRHELYGDVREQAHAHDRLRQNQAETRTRV